MRSVGSLAKTGSQWRFGQPRRCPPSTDFRYNEAKALRQEPAEGKMEWSKVATVTHYFDRIGVAAMTLEGDLALGDWIAFARGGELLFEQEVTSMQIEHQNIEFATQGDAIGMKVKQQVREGVEVYKRLQ
jgi:hypothetical protein